MKRLAWLLLFGLLLFTAACAEERWVTCEVDSSASMFRVTKCVLHIEDGGMTAALTLSGKGYGYLYRGTAEEAAGDEAGWIPYQNIKGKYVYLVPVPALDEEVPVAAYSTKKQTWYDRMLVFHSEKMKTLRGDPPEIFSSSDIPFSWSGGSGKMQIVCESLSGDTARIRFSSPHIAHVTVEGQEISGTYTPSTSTFVVPVSGPVVTVSALTTAMSQPHEVEYTLYFSELPGLVEIETEENRYASGFTIRRYAGDVVRITTAHQDLLVVPDEAELPAVPETFTVLRRPHKVYLSASSVMSLLLTLDVLPSVRFSSLSAADWTLDEACAAMEAGDVLYAGRYADPDYELLLREGCDLSIASTMLDKVPKVSEMLTVLHIPVFVDRSSEETLALGKLEWIRVYGALFGRDAEALAFFDAQEARVKNIPVEEKQTAAFFYRDTAGSYVVRPGEDAVGNALELAGLINVFADVTRTDGVSARITPEAFYAAAKDADLLIFNGTYGDAPESLEELCKTEMFAEFRAVQTGNVYVTGRSFYQASAQIVDVIEELANQAESGVFLRKLR